MTILNAVKDAKTPADVCTALRGHCEEITSAGREYMETTKGKPVPEDCVMYPGKMDHYSIVCVRAALSNPLHEQVIVPANYQSLELPSVELSAQHPSEAWRTKTGTTCSLPPEIADDILRGLQDREEKDFQKRRQKEHSTLSSLSLALHNRTEHSAKKKTHSSANDCSLEGR
jgi:hypothetical protein